MDPYHPLIIIRADRYVSAGDGSSLFPLNILALGPTVQQCCLKFFFIDFRCFRSVQE